MALSTVSVPPAFYPQDQCGAANDAEWSREARFADLLRGFVTRWETLDFGISATCFDLDDRMLAWHDADGPQRPR